MRLALVGTPRSLGPVRPELMADLPEGTRLEAWPSRVGVFPSGPLERDMQALGHLEAGLCALEADVDALVLDTLGDYGLAALRAVSARPVVGAGEAGMGAAAERGRFAIVTVWPASMNFVPEGLLRAYGHEASCLAIHNVGLEEDLANLSGPEGYLGQVGSGAQTLLARIDAAIARACAQGAEAILLGCTCMSPIAARLAQASRVPVINPLREAARLAVQRAASAAPKPAQPPVARLAAVRAMVDAVADLPEEACPVCVVAQAF
ncbi:hypothetical protein HT136_15955 [Novosphingobium profundi]|uniref:aspartate/glutamate racemase family protein n=1 Tax=Novosphingobium profundi TaxID=1774954 RepID=UPI001BDAA67B|nr:aspartate/glutamate racemase family protein [Novosphingobium profundi]MBT0669859.1 hypothetical protein [Novosphingobium profundi]